MGKVLKVDCSVAEAFVEKDLGSDEATVWVTYNLLAEAAAIAFWEAGNQVDLCEVRDPTDSGYNDTVGFDVSGWATGWAGPSGTPTFTPSTWLTVELEHVASGDSTLYIDGSLVLSGTDALGTDTRFLVLGQISAFTDAAAVVYFDDVKVGTTRGASDLFADDFEDGTLDAWTTTSGDVSVIDDPFSPPEPATNPAIKILVAFTDDTLTEEPDFTDLAAM